MKDKKEETPELQSLKALIGEARELNPIFKQKYDYWALRRKIPTEWLFKQLELILGPQRIRAEISRLI